jgi:phage repressor protein C with HTH and peptisase S24 domain
MSKIVERIALILENKGLSVRAFEINIGASNGMIGRAIAKNTDISAQWLSKIIEIYPDVNANWLLTGKGEIFATKTPQKVSDENPNRNPIQNPNFPNLQKRLGFDEPKIITLDTSNNEVIPIVDVSAAAGGGAYNPDYIETVDTIKLPATMLRKGIHNCIRVDGDSMAPTLQDGGYVISRLLDRSEWEYIKTGYVYVVSTTDGRTFVKRLRNRLHERGFVVCTSDNPEKDHFRNFNLKEDELNTVWEVEWYMSARMPNIHETYYGRMQEMIDDIDDLKETVTKVLKKMN